MSLKEGDEGLLAEAMFRTMRGEPPDAAILAQEARGQSKLVESSLIPVSYGYDDQDKCDEELRKVGFVLGDVLEDDPLFREATLPTGWEKKASDRDTWSHIIDAQKRERVGVFYKAAFYDRKAHMHLNPRFRLTRGRSARRAQPDHDPNDLERYPDDEDYVVLDYAMVPPTEALRIKVAPEPPEGPDDAFRRRQDAANALVRSWLVEHCPRWEDASAYWDEESGCDVGEAGP